MPSPSLSDALARAQVFAELRPEQLEMLAAGARVRRYDKGEQVFARGDAAGAMYVLIQGSITLSITTAEGGEVMLAVLAPPETFGELAVIDGGPRVATATARRPSTVVAVALPRVRAVLAANPDTAMAMLGALATLIRRIDEHVTDLVFLDLQGRLLKFLAAGTTGRAADRDGFVPVDVALNQSELARILGGSRQQVNKLIVALEASGSLRRSGSRITGVRP
jgi:CRP/FNR family transcriptional regulator, cyclic AMP receptor protein